MADLSLQDLVGMAQKDAVALLDDKGICHRIVSEDGVAFFGTADFRVDRANLYIVNGAVSEVAIG